MRWVGLIIASTYGCLVLSHGLPCGCTAFLLTTGTVQNVSQLAKHDCKRAEKCLYMQKLIYFLFQKTWHNKIPVRRLGSIAPQLFGRGRSPQWCWHLCEERLSCHLVKKWIALILQLQGPARHDNVTTYTYA